MDRARNENGELNRFFNWAYRTRGNTVKALAEGEHITANHRGSFCAENRCYAAIDGQDPVSPIHQHKALPHVCHDRVQISVRLG